MMHDFLIFNLTSLYFISIYTMKDKVYHTVRHMLDRELVLHTDPAVE